MNLTGVKQPG